MSAAADLLRQALADAPDGLHVARAPFDLLSIHYGSGFPLCADDEQSAMHLIGLLLAAAPHLADALELVPTHRNVTADRHRPMRRVRDAITEAARAMEVDQ